MKNGIFTLGWGDLARGLLVAVLAALFLQLLTVLNAPGFDFLTFNWGETLRLVLVSGVGYLAKNLFTSNQGNVLAIGDK